MATQAASLNDVIMVEAKKEWRKAVAAAKEPKAKKARVAVAAGGKKPPKKDKRQRKREYGSYGLYVYKVHKQINPNLSISNRSVAIMNSFCCDMFERLAKEASRLARYNARRTLLARNFRAAVILNMPGELAVQANSNALKAVTRSVEGTVLQAK